MHDTRLSPDQLDAAVDFAYGGGAWQAGRRAQARTLRCLLRRRPARSTAPAADRPTRA